MNQKYVQVSHRPASFTHGRGGADHVATAMSGPAFDTSAVFAPLRLLPPQLVLPCIGGLLALAMGMAIGVGLAAPRYPVSPDVCRSAQAAAVAPPEPAGSCVPATAVEVTR